MALRNWIASILVLILIFPINQFYLEFDSGQLSDEIEINESINGTQGVNSTDFIAASLSMKNNQNAFSLIHNLQQPEYMLNDHLLVTHGSSGSTIGGSQICNSTCYDHLIVILNVTSKLVEGYLESDSAFNYQVVNGTLHLNIFTNKILKITWPLSVTKYENTSDPNYSYSGYFVKIFDYNGTKTSESLIRTYFAGSEPKWPGNSSYQSGNYDWSTVSCVFSGYVGVDESSFLLVR